MVNLLKFVGSPLSKSEETYDDEFIKKLQTTIQEVKRSREMGARYMTFQELLDDERALGHAEGLEEGLERGKIMGMIQTARKYHATDSEILNIL